MAKFPWKPWHEVVKLREDLRSGELPLHLFAADLYEVLMQRGKRPVYEKPKEFFARLKQMNLYLNYVREHLLEPGENEPVGLILCSAKNEAVVHYAMGGIKAKVFASHYLTNLPDEETLRKEILTTQHALLARLPAGTPRARKKEAKSHG